MTGHDSAASGSLPQAHFLIVRWHLSRSAQLDKYQPGHRWLESIRPFVRIGSAPYGILADTGAMTRVLAATALGVLAFTFTYRVSGQSLGNAGTIVGMVVDPSGAAVVKAVVSLHNPISDYRQSTMTAADGSFRLVNIPPNQYHLEVRASGFAVFSQDVTIRNSLPVQVKAALEIAGGQTTVTVEAAGADLLEVNPSDHVDADRAQLSKLPALRPRRPASARRSPIARAAWPPMATDSSIPWAITRRSASSSTGNPSAISRARSSPRSFP